MTNHSITISRFVEPAVTRFGLWIALATLEYLVISGFVNVKALLDIYVPSNGLSAFALTTIFRWVLIAVAVYAVMSWPNRQRVVDAWTAIAFETANIKAVLVNLALLSLFTILCMTLSGDSGTIEGLSWPLLVLLAALGVAIIASLVDILVPVHSFCALLWSWRGRLALSMGLSACVIALVNLKRVLWSGDLLAGATLHLSSAMMHLYEPAVHVNVAERMITVGDFTALISVSCSGMEGIALVAVFVSIYLWIFRSALTFPKAFLLYPIGFAASFTLNSVRIAALTSIGAHISPEMAVQGFHSRAGWISLVIVVLSLVLLSVSWVSRRQALAGVQAQKVPVRYAESTTYLIPFVALMVGTLIVSAAAPLHYPVYVFKVAIVAAALWSIRQTYAIWSPRISVEAIGGGLFVGAVWIVTQPSVAGANALGVWLAELGPVLAALWLIARGIGTIVLVPIAEELAFRGYIYRRLISRDFFEVDPTKLSWFALGASSMLFGLLHNRWELGVFAGVVFALVMLRRGRLGDAVTAHAVANALIFFWALAFQQWSLL